MSTTEVLTADPSQIRLKDYTHKKKHARAEVSDESKPPQPDQDRSEDDGKRKRKKGKAAEAVYPSQEKDRKTKKRDKREDEKLVAQTSGPLQAEQLVGVVTPDSSQREKKKKHGESVRIGAGENSVQAEETGESSERAAEKELKRARKEARRREKADRAGGKDAAADIIIDQQAEDSGELMEESKNKDKRKRKAESGDVVKKSKKRRTGVAQEILNPEEDEELSEQARKALSYAYAQFADEANWKFNKARQNWLLRNVWSESNVPEKFMPLLSKYLAKVQGGVRENLIKTCKARLVVSAVTSSPGIDTPTTEAPQSAAVPDSSTLSTASEAKRSRAKTILEALSAN